MKKVLMYCHGGSGNHGCEAIVKSTTDLLINNNIHDINLISSRKKEDIKYGVDKKVKIYNEINSPRRNSVKFLIAYIRQKFFKDYRLMDKLSYVYPYEVCGKNTISLSIGGDNYCYGDSSKYIGFHNISKENGHKTVLWGCSIDLDVLDNNTVVKDLKSFDKIIVRESLTYDKLIDLNFKNVLLYPDPAFSLVKDEDFNILPKKNTVGINISPLILKYGENNLLKQNYVQLIQYILDKTDMNISLIPHVIWEKNDDRESLKELKRLFNDERITIIDDYNCKQLKKYISNLRFLIAARTHASIAAYSTCVPTLVAGYSIKSKGIAKDIFGTYEHYVVPVQNLTSYNEFTDEFIWLMENENNIKKHLNDFMPNYIKKSEDSVKKILTL